MKSDEIWAQEVLETLRRAVAKALDKKRRLGQYAVMVVDGKVVRVEPEDLPALDKPGQIAHPSES